MVNFQPESFGFTSVSFFADSMIKNKNLNHMMIATELNRCSAWKTYLMSPRSPWKLVELPKEMNRVLGSQENVHRSHFTRSME